MNDLTPLSSPQRKSVSKEKKQYFIALSLPGELSREITRIKDEFAERYDSHHALKLPPHITVVAPFRAPVDLEQLLLGALPGLAAAQAPFPVYLEGFGSFRHGDARVIFIGVAKSDRLQRLHNDLLALFTETAPGLKLRADIPFHPHLTIAHRDLSAITFEKAWPAYQDKQLRADFEAARMILFRHDGQRWHPLQSYAFTRR
jgi:2'-5' RNA ligase